MIGNVDFFPVTPMIRTAIGSMLRANVNDFRVQGVYRNGSDGRSFRKAVGQQLPTTIIVGHPIQSGLDHAARRSFAREASIYIGRTVARCTCCHGVFLHEATIGLIEDSGQEIEKWHGKPACDGIVGWSEKLLYP